MLSYITGKTQDASVEKSIFEIQTGFLGVWTYNEIKFTNRISLRSEIGNSSRLWGGSYFDNKGFLMTPIFTVEPILYYNLESRNINFKQIDHNSGNFLLLKFSYQPYWLELSEQDNNPEINAFSIIPTWSLSRLIGQHLCYEAGWGIGYRRLFGEDLKDIVTRKMLSTILFL
ncbi:MAG: hypothetical protein AB7S50_03565 [Bacteroidales bacterium]